MWDSKSNGGWWLICWMVFPYLTGVYNLKFWHHGVILLKHRNAIKAFYETLKAKLHQCKSCTSAVLLLHKKLLTNVPLGRPFHQTCFTSHLHNSKCNIIMNQMTEWREKWVDLNHQGSHLLSCDYEGLSSKISLT